MALGATFGIIMGATPGLTGTLGIALLLPFTFGLDPTLALLMLGSVYCGSEYGGSIPAILINTPGTAAALCTTFDGYKMTQKGMAQEALNTALIVSVLGGFFGVFALIFLSIPLAHLSMKFGAPEQFWLSVFALTVIAGLSSGNVLKGIIGGLFGLLLSTVGMDPVTGYPRFTFGTLQLMGGVNIIPTLIGLFAIPQALLLLGKRGEGKVGKFKPRGGLLFKTFKEVMKRVRVGIQSGIIGVIIGIMPGAGGNIATFIAYNEAKRFSKKPEEFGTGIYEGVIAPEACNNAVVGGAQIPLLTLGIPGSAPAAVLLGALMIHGLRPGFKLFSQHGDIVFTYMIGLFISNLIILLLGSIFVRLFVRVLQVPKKYMVAAILCLAVVGSYSIRNASIDAMSMMVAGIVGFFLIRFGFGVAPTALGLILGELTEEGFKLSLIIGAAKGSVWSYFFSRPASIILIGLTLLSLAYAFYRESRGKQGLNRPSEGRR
ncbi:MAG: tripartite tricarboxylate transporter permease [Deltaproteobacteria bacterium]|nr:tripartite tricarboxylate transporter permease [Deltaproteobacteria bacterium]MBW2305469.1 tripartite tricarboxylate transporter permease [Deltaproteobacteria bacterium]